MEDKNIYDPDKFRFADVSRIPQVKNSTIRYRGKKYHVIHYDQPKYSFVYYHNRYITIPEFWKTLFSEGEITKEELFLKLL